VAGLSGSWNFVSGLGDRGCFEVPALQHRLLSSSYALPG
jgi:hypothetical protein